MKLSGKGTDVNMKLQIASLIDIVFLLLIYFMVTASLVRKEADVGFALPAPGPLADNPVEVVIQIQKDGSIQMDGLQFADNQTSTQQLVSQIRGLRMMARNQGSEFFVNLLPDGDAVHRRVIDAMEACSAAGVDALTFSKSI